MQLVFAWHGGGRSFIVRAGEIKVGSAPDADLRLELPGLARHHAVIEINDDGDVAVRPTPGQSQVTVNRQAARQRTLVTPGDTVQLGPVQLRVEPFSLPAAPQPGGAPAGGTSLPAAGPDNGPAQQFPQTTVPVSADPRPGRLRRASGVLITLVVTAVLLGLALLAVFGPVGFTASFIAALVPAPLLLVYLRSIDHFTPAPTRLLWVTFLWGATVAVIGALILQAPVVLLSGLESDGLEDAFFAAVVLAPVVEELAKAAAVVWVLWRYRSAFNGLMHGLVYGAMAGMGFAVTEDLLYYATTLIEEGPVAFAGVVFLRGVISAFAHPLFSAVAGIGIALAVEARRARWFPPLVGIGAAMLLHGFWNYSAYRTAVNESAFALLAYAMVFVPVFVAFLVIAQRVMRREGRVVVHQLQSEVADRRLTQAEVATLGDPTRRRAALAQARRAGPAAARHMRELQRAASELAFLRHRVARARRQPTPAELDAERRLIGQVQRQRASLLGKPIPSLPRCGWPL